MDIREVFDKLRQYYAKQVKPFQELPEVIEAAIQIIEHDVPAAKKELETLTKMIADLQASKPDVESEVAETTRRVEMARNEAATEEASARARITMVRQDAEVQTLAITREFEHRAATLERDYTTRHKQLMQEITALEAKKAALDEAITALRAKF